ncbi:hypothetical protein PISMIDRAFT_680517 [Pisolithus microcarpus 441]|uniref:Uncharacterized protein n=1 Tax=Pisolithus microcarpus 441 TaxID=765257 RepID=A0A0C9ZI70_9AGAM|nr:hypothetical protein PISMIDRAFT_680517 [Pisolithus microcarpus 441]
MSLPSPHQPSQASPHIDHGLTVSFSGFCATGHYFPQLLGPRRYAKSYIHSETCQHRKCQHSQKSDQGQEATRLPQRRC